MRRAGNGTVGSNPTLSATFRPSDRPGPAAGIGALKMLLGHGKVTSACKAVYVPYRSSAGHPAATAFTCVRWAKDRTGLSMENSAMRILSFGIVALCLTGPVTAYQASISAPQTAQAADRSGQQDFDFEFGTWTTKVRVLRNPLSGSEPVWAEYQGTSVVRPLMDGRANVVELSVEGPTGRIEGVSLRLYNPQARQWSLNYAGVRNGLMTAPVYGRFNGRGSGTFYGQDMLDGRAIMVRFVVSQISKDEARFVQSYSSDGGASWEVNWDAVDVRRDGQTLLR